MKDNIVYGIGLLTLIGIVTLVIVELTRKPKVRTRNITRTKFVPVIKRYPQPYPQPYPVPRPEPRPRPYPPHPRPPHPRPPHPRPPQPRPDPSIGPYCEHTKCGCYPGTTTPIPNCNKPVNPNKPILY